MMPLIELKCEVFKWTGTPIKCSSFLGTVFKCTVRGVGSGGVPQDGFCDFLWLGYLCSANGGGQYVHEAQVNQVSATAYADDPALQVTLRLSGGLDCWQNLRLLKRQKSQRNTQQQCYRLPNIIMQVIHETKNNNYLHQGSQTYGPGVISIPIKVLIWLAILNKNLR